MAVRILVVACLLAIVTNVSIAAPANPADQVIRWVGKAAKKLTNTQRKTRRKKTKAGRKSKTKVDKAHTGTKPNAAPKKSKASSQKANAKTAMKTPPLPVRKKEALGQARKKTIIKALITPKPDIWTPEETAEARKTCARILKRIKAVTLPVAPMKKGACGNAAPVSLISVGSNPEISFSPPAKVNCQMVEALYKWTTKQLQPMARKLLKAPIIKVEVMSDYSCRNAYGRKRGRLSEHAMANALDIRGFVTRKGKTARLLAHWGPTKRDIARVLAEKKAAEEKRKKELAAAKERERKFKAMTDASAKAKKDASRSNKIKTGAVANKSDVAKSSFSAAPNKLGGPKRGQPRFSPPNNATARFLRQAHIAACKTFGTVLGPEANNAHRNHFHVDLAPRRRSNYCE